MTYEDAVAIWEASRQTSQIQLLDGLVRASIRYARIRTDYHLADLSAKAELDATRTSAHDALIDSCNALSRWLASHGEDPGWRRRLTNNRREIGDFACLLHAYFGILAR